MLQEIAELRYDNKSNWSLSLHGFLNIWWVNASLNKHSDCAAIIAQDWKLEKSISFKPGKLKPISIYSCVYNKCTIWVIYYQCHVCLVYDGNKTVACKQIIPCAGFRHATESKFGVKIYSLRDFSTQHGYTEWSDKAINSAVNYCVNQKPETNHCSREEVNKVYL